MAHDVCRVRALLVGAIGRGRGTVRVADVSRAVMA